MEADAIFLYTKKIICRRKEAIMGVQKIQAVKYTNTAEDKVTTLKQLSSYLQNLIVFGEELENEEDRERYEARIHAKLQTGKRLTPKELRYLQKNNTALYAQAIRIEAKRRGVEARLKCAQSKQVVEEIQFEALSTISKKDPARAYMIAAVKETVREFKQTQKYRSLPKKDEVLLIGSYEHGLDDKAEIRGEYAIKYEYEKGAYQVAYIDTLQGEGITFVATS